MVRKVGRVLGDVLLVLATLVVAAYMVAVALPYFR